MEGREGDALLGRGRRQPGGQRTRLPGADHESRLALEPQAVGQPRAAGDLGQPPGAVGGQSHLRGKGVDQATDLLDIAAGDQPPTEDHREAGIERLDLMQQMAGHQEAAG